MKNHHLPEIALSCPWWFTVDDGVQLGLAVRQASSTKKGSRVARYELRAPQRSKVQRSRRRGVFGQVELILLGRKKDLPDNNFKQEERINAHAVNVLSSNRRYSFQ